MDHEDARALRLARPTAGDFLSDLTGRQIDAIRQRVRASIDSLEAGGFGEYQGRVGLKRLADEVKSRGRNCLAREAPGP
jgi:hypothetical protein